MLATLSLAGCLESGSSASHSAYSSSIPAAKAIAKLQEREQGNAKGARSTVRVKFDQVIKLFPSKQPAVLKRVRRLQPIWMAH